MLAVILVGFAAAAAAPFVCKRAGDRSGWILAMLPAALAVYFGEKTSAIAGGQVLRESHAWAPALGVEWSFALDGLSLLFALVVSGVGAVVVVYASGYLAGKADLGRFQAVLLMFMASMLGVVLSDNLLTLFVFWELTSVCSYLLIGYYHEREGARSAALQALLVTGLGGLALLAGVLLLGEAAGTMRISELEAVTSHQLYLPALILILIGAFTKSAQFPFHFWLPNAMEAPAPVSAYLHAATMVKAGVYLMFRLHSVLGNTDAWHVLVGGTGAVTMLMAGYLSFRQQHLKRVLAYSTVSALGTLFFLLGLGTTAAIHAALVFFAGHVLYKGALFLAAGNIERGAGSADLRDLRGLRRAMPWTGAAVMAAAAVMAGLPPTFGFIAKESFFLASWAFPAAGALLMGMALVTSVFIIAAAGMVSIRPLFGPSGKAVDEAPPRLLAGPVLLGGLGVAFGLFPGPVERWLLAPASSAVVGIDVPLNLGLWHGWNIAVACSVISVALGCLLLVRREVLLKVLLRFDFGRVGPARWYDAVLSGTVSLAKGQTGILQAGFLRRYVFIVFATVLAVTGYSLLRQGMPLEMPRLENVRFHEAVLAGLSLAAAMVTVCSRSRMGAIVALGVVGYSIGALFALFGAPDLAVTQFIVETLLVVLLLFVFYRLPRYTVFSTAGSRVRDAALAVGVGVVMTVLTLAAASVQWYPAISGFFGEAAVTEAFGRNVVNVILVDFRAMDTLGEIIVVAAAALGVFSLLRLRRGRSEP